jgi:hypothetical protein
MAVFASYRPELHYMRGRGPKWREKHARAPADLTIAIVGTTQVILLPCNRRRYPVIAGRLFLVAPSAARAERNNRLSDAGKKAPARGLIVRG